MADTVKVFPILLPKDVDYSKWAVIACDQFTSQPDYWKELDAYVGDAPSTLRITYPELYLNDNRAKRIDKINKTMEEYLDRGLFREINSFVLVEREVEGGDKRVGLVLSVDLEKYDYRCVNAPIRATEDTILERLPVRIEIRENAPIELPHIILLIDDNDKNIIEPIYKNRDRLTKLYDFDLNMNGGHITGYEVEDCQAVKAKLNALLDTAVQDKKYGKDANIQFAVGDGNHSMATAKEHWNKIKSGLTEEEQKVHPSRFALVEVMNIYDDALKFEPIHRVIKTGGEYLLNVLKNSITGDNELTVITPEGKQFIDCPRASSETIRQVQSVIECELKKGTITVDYVHGEKHLEDVVKSCNGVGLIMPEFGKNELFNYVVNVGNLPKKAFSIGTAENKKYYIEAKRIK